MDVSMEATGLQLSNDWLVTGLRLVGNRVLPISATKQCATGKYHLCLCKPQKLAFPVAELTIAKRCLLILPCVSHGQLRLSGVITKYTRWSLLSGAWLHDSRGICCFVVHTWSLQMLQTGTTSSWYNRHNTPDTLAYRNEKCGYAVAGLGLQILQQLGGINTVMVSSPYQTSYRTVSTNAAQCWCLWGRSFVHLRVTQHLGLVTQNRQWLPCRRCYLLDWLSDLLIIN